MFYVATEGGFIGGKRPTANIRWARNFPTYKEAEQFASRLHLKWYAILRS